MFLPRGKSDERSLRKRLRQVNFSDLDLMPDLGARIGSLTWYRGTATCVGLCALTLLLAPGFENPIYGTVPPKLSGSDWDATRAQAIQPLGMGAATGYRVAATRLVEPLTDTPERPILQASAKLASGHNLQSLLQRSGVGKGDASAVGNLITKAVSLNEIQPGTMLDLTLGRRTDKSQPRPLEKLELRARFDLKLEVSRSDGGLSLREIPISIDHTPLRIQGAIGKSLYRSARAAGAPAKAVETYIKTVAGRVPVSKLGPDCQFDMIVRQARAETGEVQLGELLYAGVTGCQQKLQLAAWKDGSRTDWYDARGKGSSSGTAAMPAHGRFSSNFGMRRHPILGYQRMHKGMDIAAPHGAPVYAAADGVVKHAGRASGYGNLIRLDHGAGNGSGYGHLSRIQVRVGERVRKGQRIGSVGSTGMSTGPHLHYEWYRNGQAVNPRSVSFSSTRQLGGRDMAEFRSELNRLLAVPVGQGASKAD